MLRSADQISANNFLAERVLVGLGFLGLFRLLLLLFTLSSQNNGCNVLVIQGFGFCINWCVKFILCTWFKSYEF